MRRIAESFVAGIILALLVVGLSVIVLTAPGYTSLMVRATGGATLAGLDQAMALDLAQQVRAYVTRADAPALPVTVAGREGFTPEASAHLDDVREVFSLARRLTGLLAGIVAAWIAFGISRRRYEALVAGLRAGAVVTVVLVALSVVVALSDFERFFAGFHSLFFASGTWMFSADELMVQLFPEGFWAASGVSWGVLSLLGAIVLWATAAAVARRGPARVGA